MKNSRKNKTVFIAFDTNQYNYSNITNKEIMFHINLDEEEIITKENVNLLSIRHIKLHKTSSTKKIKMIKLKGMFIQS